MRQIVLDTETTGLEPKQGHQVIEIGCVELENRRLTGRHYHQYIKPDRDIDAGAIEVHGITNDFLADKPSFAAVVDEFLAFVEGAELVIHNAPFDINFIDTELSRLSPSRPSILEICTVVDTLVMAREKHPGAKNNLDALCKRYDVDNSQRDLHGALLDAEILADVYLMMTGGQTALLLGGSGDSEENEGGVTGIRRLASNRPKLQVIKASDDELAAHAKKLQELDKRSGGNCLWLKGLAD